MAANQMQPWVKAGTTAARQAFLYGTGDGRRVLDPQKLAEIGDVHVSTVWRHLPAWQKEYEEILASANSGSLALRLSAETLAQHQRNTEFLETQMVQARREVESAQDLEKLLRKGIAEAEIHDPDGAQALLLVVQSFCNTVNGRKALQSQFLNYEARWKENAGIDSLQAVAEAREKTLATGRARLDLKREDAQDKPQMPQATGQTVDSVFDVGPEDDGAECG